MTKQIEFGTYNRGTPCSKCGGAVFYVTSGNCVPCQRECGAKDREKRKQEGDADTGSQKGRRGRKMAEAASDRSLMNDILSRKW